MSKKAASRTMIGTGNGDMYEKRKNKKINYIAASILVNKTYQSTLQATIMSTNNQMTITSELTSLIAEVPAAQTRCSNIAALLGVSLAISPMDTPPEMEEPGAPVPNPTIPNPVRRTATSLEERAALLLEHPTDEIVLQFQTKAEYDARTSHPEYNGITCEYVCNGNVRSALLNPLFQKFEEMMHAVWQPRCSPFSVLESRRERCTILAQWRRSCVRL
jgi:hypothetical protein